MMSWIAYFCLLTIWYWFWAASHMICLCWGWNWIASRCWTWEEQNWRLFCGCCLSLSKIQMSFKRKRYTWDQLCTSNLVDSHAFHELWVQPDLPWDPTALQLFLVAQIGQGIQKVSCLEKERWFMALENNIISYKIKQAFLFSIKVALFISMCTSYFKS